MKILAKQFPESMSTTSRIVSKRNFQSLLGKFRKDEKFVVTKLDAGYTVHFLSDKEAEARLVIKAMIGTNGYLTRYDTKLLK